MSWPETFLVTNAVEFSLDFLILFPQQMERESAQKCSPQFSQHLGILSHHLKCEMKSPHLVDFS